MTPTYDPDRPPERPTPAPMPEWLHRPGDKGPLPPLPDECYPPSAVPLDAFPADDTTRRFLDHEGGP